VQDHGSRKRNVRKEGGKRTELTGVDSRHQKKKFVGKGNSEQEASGGKVAAPFLVEERSEKKKRGGEVCVLLLHLGVNLEST